MTDYYKLSTILWVAFFIFVLQGCAVLSEPAYEGQIVDIETKEPIEGASVVALYMSESSTFVAGSIPHIVNVREAVTDQTGHFHIPSYVTTLFPGSWADETRFIVYKPGYVSIVESPIGSCFIGDCETSEIGWPRDRKVTYVVSPRKVELSRLTHWKDQLFAIPASEYLKNEKDTPHLVSLRDAEKNRIYKEHVPGP